jgi:hypothetical protein
MALRDSSCSNGLHGPDRQALDASNCHFCVEEGDGQRRLPGIPERGLKSMISGPFFIETLVGVG